jgi:hypothetical protein
MMIVDCMTCPVRAQRCDDCAVTVLRASGWGQSSTELQLDAAENRVVSIFVGAGLVNAGTVLRLRARRESGPLRDAVRDVG